MYAPKMPMKCAVSGSPRGQASGHTSDRSMKTNSMPNETTNNKTSTSNLRTGEVRLMTRYQRGLRIVRAWRRLQAMLHTAWLRVQGAHIGRHVYFGKSSQIYGHAGINIADGVNLGHRVRLETHLTEHGQAQLTIGSGTCIGNDFHAGAALRVLIGRNCMLASACTVLDHDHDFSDPFTPHHSREGVVAAETVIEDSVFLGERVIVLKGVRIGNGSVIGANSVVCSDIPPLTMAAGIPARPLRRWSESTGKWERIAAPNSADASGRSGVGH